MLRLSNISLDGITTADWLCWKKQTCGLQELREWVGDDSLLRLLAIYPGTYLRLPSAKELMRMVMDLELAKAWTELKRYRATRDLEGQVLAEQKIMKIAQKLGRTPGWARLRARQLVKDLDKVFQWKRDMTVWRKRYGLEAP